MSVEFQNRAPTEKAPWEPMTITYVGSVSEIIQYGRGKLSLTGGDPGEPRKQKVH